IPSTSRFQISREQDLGGESIETGLPSLFGEIGSQQQFLGLCRSKSLVKVLDRNSCDFLQPFSELTCLERFLTFLPIEMDRQPHHILHDLFCLHQAAKVPAVHLHVLSLIGLKGRSNSDTRIGNCNSHTHCAEVDSGDSTATGLGTEGCQAAE